MEASLELRLLPQRKPCRYFPLPGIAVNSLISCLTRGNRPPPLQLGGQSRQHEHAKGYDQSDHHCGFYTHVSNPDC